LSTNIFIRSSDVFSKGNLLCSRKQGQIDLLIDRIKTGRVIMYDPADAAGNSAADQFRRVRPTGLLQPKIPLINGKENRHAMMNLPHVMVSSASDDNALSIAPKAGKSEKPTVRQLEIIGGPLFPLEKSVSRDEAAVSRKQTAEHGTIGQGLRPGIDDSRSLIFKTPEAALSCAGISLPYNGDML
jgi:hypothetical protein